MIKIEIISQKKSIIEGIFFDGEKKTFFMLICGFTDNVWRLYYAETKEEKNTRRFRPCKNFPFFLVSDYKNRKIIKWMGENFNKIKHPNIELISVNINIYGVSLVKGYVKDDDKRHCEFMLSHDPQYDNYWFIYILKGNDWSELGEFPAFSFRDFENEKVINWIQENRLKLLELKYG